MAKKAKKTPVKKKKKLKHQPRPSLLKRLFKLGFLAAIWGSIALAFLVFIYAYDLPNIREAMKFDKRPSITILANDQSVFTRYGDSQGRYYSASELPENVVNAILATEDRRFYSHFGIDPIGLSRAMATNIVSGRVVQGGSTITQQLAKILFLTPERTLSRKFKEALTSLWLEYAYSKDEILSAYINRVYLGSGTYGFDAAAQRYFGRNITQVSLPQAALLAGLLKAPSRYSPLNNPELSQKRMITVLGAMEDAGFIDEAAYQDAITYKVTKADHAYQVDYFTSYIIDRITPYTGSNSNDLIIYTTIEPRLQDAAQKIVSDTVSSVENDRNVHQGAALVLRKDGGIAAMVGGRDFGKSEYNRAIQAERQAGSSFKPFVYLTAIEKLGLTPDDMVEDKPINIDGYAPQNYDKTYHGVIPLKQAFGLSLNTVSVQMAYKSGISSVIQTARRAGLTGDMPRDLSLALGSASTSMIDMTAAYAVIANDGRAVQPFAIKRIKTIEGEVLFEHDEYSPPSVFNKSDIYMLKDMMYYGVEQGTGKRARMDKRSVFGKTGTSEDYRDAWFIGFTDNYIGAVWMGNDDNSPTNGITGGSYPAMMWKRIMVEAHRDIPEESQSYDQKNDGDFINRIMNIFN